VTAPRTASKTATPGGAPEVTHACVRCGAQVAIDVGLCERCNPLGLRDSSASQMHGIAIGGVVLFIVIMAVVARFALAGIGPFEGSVAGVVPDGDGLAITLSVTNHGTSSGQTTCRVTDPVDRTGNVGGFMLSPQIGPGESLTFTQRSTALGTTVRPLVAECSSP
jgi:ribosomal protein L40E